MLDYGKHFQRNKIETQKKVYSDADSTQTSNHEQKLLRVEILIRVTVYNIDRSIRKKNIEYYDITRSASRD